MAQAFCRDIQQRIVAAGLSSESLGCMDEVPLRFIYPSGGYLKADCLGYFSQDCIF